MGWIVVFVIAGLACVVLYASDQPNHRRKKKDPRYVGPERRESCEDQDFLQSPAFTTRRSKKSDRVEPTSPTDQS